jgi:hypothetical protein
LTFNVEKKEISFFKRKGYTKEEEKNMHRGSQTSKKTKRKKPIDKN